MPYRSARQPCGWSLPGDAQLAVWIIPNIEFFPLDEVIPDGAGTVPDIPYFSVRDYGARVGFWRVAEALMEVDAPVTAALNSEVCHVYPDIAQAIAEARWEVIGHCRTNNRRLSEMDEKEERATILDTSAILKKKFGSSPRGWLGAGLQERWTTLEVLAGSGYSYVADWCSDDRPDMTWDRSLITMPYPRETNDKVAFDAVRMSSPEFADLVLRQFDVLWREGSLEPRVFGLALHPYLMGVPHRSDHLRRILNEMRERPNVWWATGSEIADVYKDSQ